MRQLALINQLPLDDTLVSYEFAAQVGLTWQAGQFIELSLPVSPHDAAGDRRYFTIAAAPHEGLVRVVTRRGHSLFKQALSGLKPGDTINISQLPAGDFVWGNHAEPRLLIASGVGITPFYAMVKDRVYGGQPEPTHLLYFHARTRLPFEAEWRAWERDYPQLRITTLTDSYSPNLLAEIIEPAQLQSLQVYLSGPMTPTKLMLPPFNLTSHQLHSDQFTGYTSADY